MFSRNEEYFIYVVALGPYVNVSFEASQSLKKYFGYFAYVLYVLKEFFSSVTPFNLTYKTDEVTDSGKYSLILASNSNSVGGLKLKALSDTNFCDGKFEFKALKI